MKSNLVGAARAIGWLAPFKNPIHVGRGASTLVVKVHRIRHEAADIHKMAMAPQRRYSILGSEGHNGLEADMLAIGSTCDAVAARRGAGFTTSIGWLLPSRC